MFITVEEMYALKEQYSKEILELEMKKSVIDDFIRIAEAKEPCESESDETVDAEYEQQSETATEDTELGNV